MPVLDEDDNLLWIAAVMPVAVTGFSLIIYLQSYAHSEFFYNLF